jgi:hypothetical protein
MNEKEVAEATSFSAMKLSVLPETLWIIVWLSGDGGIGGVTASAFLIPVMAPLKAGFKVPYWRVAEFTVTFSGAAVMVSVPLLMVTA